MFAARVLTVAALLTAAAASSVSAQTPTGKAALDLETEATERIEQIEDVARSVQYHIGRIEALIGSTTVSAWSHYHHLEAIRDEVNMVLRPALVRLAAIEQALPAWKQDGITRMERAAQDLAADMSSALFLKAKDPRVPPLVNAQYRQLMRDVAGHAETLVKTAEAAHAYAVAHRKATAAGLAVTKH